ncbi:hypothetical protein V6N13_115277 [Hibiscus sabdariffa]
MASRSYCTIYVGNLPLDVKEWEIEDLFYKFEDPLDAEDAIKGRDGYNFDRCRIRVELAHGGRGQSSRGEYGGGSEVVEDNLVLLVGLSFESSPRRVEAGVEVTAGVQEAIEGLYQNQGHLHLPDHPNQGPTNYRNVCKWLASAE